MPFSATRFEHDSAFERYVLDAVAPALLVNPGLQIVDYRQEGWTSPRIHAIASGITARAVAHVNGRPADFDITPMIFGAAWKILTWSWTASSAPSP